MALPSSGSIGANQINVELGRAASAAFSMNGAAERALAGKPSGSIGFSDFHGKSSEIVKTMTAGGSPVTLESLFSPAEWTSSTAKRVVIPSGVERGNGTNTDAAISIGPSAWGGSLTLDVIGVISGKGGAPNSGVGGDAFNANRLGASGQKLALNLTGTIRAGGGGGGKGGKGGDGSANSYTRDPTTGEQYHTTNYFYATYAPGIRHPSFPAYELKWNGVQLVYRLGSEIPYPYSHTDGWEYHRGTQMTPSNTILYAVYRTKTSIVATTGGDGGNGGRGQGYDGPRGDGAAGVAGGTNAGAGGTGGRGGLYGADGNTGEPGFNGNVSNGLPGSAGGLAGFAIRNIANVNLTNTGTIVGRT